MCRMSVCSQRTLPKLHKRSCCCTVIRHNYSTGMKLSVMDDDDYCCSNEMCNNNSSNNSTAEISTKDKKLLYQFFRYVKNLYAAALGIEILCSAAAEVGENAGLYILGFNHIGIPIAYVIGYCLATFTTFVAILGRYRYSSSDRINSCCSVLEQKELPKQPNLKEILKTSLTILVTAETACIITAETVDLIFYKQAFYLSVPLALLAGAFTVVAPEAYRKMKQAKAN